MSTGPEKKIEDKVCKWAKKNGVLPYKMNGMYTRSWPDRLFFMPTGKAFIIEFKAPGKEPTPLQEDTINKLRKLGYDVEVHDNAEAAIAALQARL